MEGSERGPLPKAKRRSLKLASQAIKKAVVPPRLPECSLRGREKKRETIGMTEKSLGIPFGTNLAEK